MPCRPCTRLIVISVLLLFVGVAQADFESEVIELVNIERETRIPAPAQLQPGTDRRGQTALTGHGRSKLL